MARTILHIGMHKTGSTSIQSAFADFRSRSVQYADLEFENHSIPIWTAYSGAHRDYHIWLASGLTPAEIDLRRDEWRGRIEAFFRGQTRDTVILSGEDISLLPEAGVAELARVITTGGRDVTVVIYVRDAVSFFQSELQERLKAGSTSADLHPPLYRFRIEKFQRIFGDGNVIVREFAPDKLIGGDVVEDFARIVGVSVPRKGMEANSSLSTEAARVLFLMNHFVSAHFEAPRIIDARERMMLHLREMLPGRFSLSLPLIGGALDRTDILWLQQTTGIDFGSSLPADPAPFNAEALRVYLSQIAPETLETIRAHLIYNCGVTAPPQEPYFLLARYFMSFLTA